MRQFHSNTLNAIYETINRAITRIIRVTGDRMIRIPLVAGLLLSSVGVATAQSVDEYKYVDLTGGAHYFASLASAEAFMRLDHGDVGELLRRFQPTSWQERPPVADGNLWTYQYSVPEMPVIPYAGFPGWRLEMLGGAATLPGISPTNQIFGSYTDAQTAAIEHVQGSHTPIGRTGCGGEVNAIPHYSPMFEF